MKNLIITIALLFGASNQAQAQNLFDLLFGKQTKNTKSMAKVYKDSESKAKVLQLDPNRTIEIIGTVTSRAISEVAVQIEKMSRKDRTKPLYLFINSPGGSVTAGTTV